MLARRLPDLIAARIQGRTRRGVHFYKPPNSEADDNLYLADYLGMAGVPVLPEAHWCDEARVVFLGAQAASDPDLLDKLRRQLKAGATCLVTPALLRRAGEAAQQLAGVFVGSSSLPATVTNLQIGSKMQALGRPLEVDTALVGRRARIRLSSKTTTGTVPLLLERRRDRGRILVVNTRTFSEADFRSEGEWLLSPKPLGLTDLPPAAVDEWRRAFLSPLRVRLNAPAGVGLYLFDGASCLYNFRDEPARVRLNGKWLTLRPHDFLWSPGS